MSRLSPIRKQLIKFSLIGILAVIVDLAFYYLFLNIFPDDRFLVVSNEVVAKSISFICGMSVTYTFNKYWTWKMKDRSQRRLLIFSLLYSVSLIINVGFNSLLLYLLHESPVLYELPYKYLIAFMGASGLSASMNFMGQKYLVFRSPASL